MTTRKVKRVTAGTLPASFGPDSGKRIVFTFIPGNGADVKDLFELRPLRTRRPERITVLDVYNYALRCRVNCEYLERARARKAAKAARLARLRQDRAEKRLFSRP